MDTSSSISADDFAHAKNFIINTTAAFTLDNGDVRVAVITYADAARVRINWGEHQSHAGLSAAIQALSYQTGATETAHALDLARTQLFNQANSRAVAIKVCILVDCFIQGLF